MGFFKVKSKKKLIDLKEGEQIPESDFASICPDGTFIQFEYTEEEYKSQPYEVKPGIWTIQKTNRGLKLEPTSFVTENILESFINTKELMNKIGCFFRNFDKYKKYGIEIPKRAALLYGPAGAGKSTSLIKVCQHYAKDGTTTIVIWPTDKLDPYEVKDFFKTFTYTDVHKVIMIAEDIGGAEAEHVKIKSVSSLLSLLDNKEKIFTKPTFIIATTNFPENFLGNITNRPGRFDDKLEMTYPNSEARYELLKFFGQGEIPENVLLQIKQKKYSELSAAHIHEVIIRSAIHEISIEDALDGVQKEIEIYKKSFDKKKLSKIGITNSVYEDDD